MENYNKTLSAGQRAKLSKVRHVALDMDGTIYLGSRLFPFTLDFLDRLDAGFLLAFRSLYRRCRLGGQTGIQAPRTASVQPGPGA